jgi:hypothetical protein
MAFIFFQMKPLIQQKLNKEVWVCGTLYLLAVTAAVFMLIGLSIPTPLKLIERIYHPLIKLFL